jgi:tetratricopeptide (TPR) repeat protein
MEYPYDLGAFSRAVTAGSPDAQRWFDRGLNWCYGYHHEEALRCFEQALAADPAFAMAHWGIAYAAGPNYNYPWVMHDPAAKAAALARAYDATQAALALAGHVTRPERALIEALPARYPQRDPIQDQRPWDTAFAEAMRAAHLANPRDLDIRAVFVEAILNRTPWRMWNPRTGEPSPRAWTLEAREVLDAGFARVPGAKTHPGLLHLHVHLMEMSSTPEAALQSADRLRQIAPDMGHLIHMPTHIDIQCGQYHDAMLWNRKAIIADRKFYDRAGPLNFYSGYRIHNYHFAAYGAMFLGQYQPAIEAANELIATMQEDLLRIPSPPMADFFESYIAIRLHVMVRFGKWEELLEISLPEDRALYCNTVAMTHYAKGVAHAALGQVPEAEAEQRLFRAAAKLVPDTRQVHNVKSRELLAIAEEMLEGEIAYRRGEHDAAFARLRAAIALEDDLPYDEPWGWMQPIRHALGALLLEQGRAAEAEAVYREDLGLAGALPPRADPPRQHLGAARPAGLPGEARRSGGGQAHPPAPLGRRGTLGSAGRRLLLLRAGDRGGITAVPIGRFRNRTTHNKSPRGSRIGAQITNISIVEHGSGSPVFLRAPLQAAGTGISRGRSQTINRKHTTCLASLRPRLRSSPSASHWPAADKAAAIAPSPAV